MIFGRFPVDDASGLVLAHSLQCGERRFAKGHVLTPADVLQLRRAQVVDVIAARLEPGDLGEDEAAARLAETIPADGLTRTDASTGRVNFHAAHNGLLIADRTVVDRFNRIDPALTFACLADHADVRAGELVATVKIIPLAVSGASVEQAVSVFEETSPIRLKPYLPHDVHLIATELPSLKASVMDKTANVLARRLAASGSTIVEETRTAHTAEAVAEAIGAALSRSGDRPSMVVIFGASAMVDAADVIPQAIRLAGGVVEQVGLPVDPGNLLVLGRLGDVAIVGAPGCARSPKVNGFDWVLNRLLAGEWPTTHDLTGLGVGGLLMEIPSRPLPRELPSASAPRLAVAALVLAAGQARRMGADGPHKLLAEFEGEPLVRRSARIAGEGGAGPVAVVTGHRAAEIEAALNGLDVRFVHNPDYASGMASSLKAGVASAGVQGADGVLVVLADMPGITAEDLARLISTFRAEQGAAIVRAVSDGKRGNPVILPKATFDAIMELEGDIGARPIVEGSGLKVVDVELGDAAHLDVDTPDAVVRAGGILKG